MKKQIEKWSFFNTILEIQLISNEDSYELLQKLYKIASDMQYNLNYYDSKSVLYYLNRRKKLKYHPKYFYLFDVFKLAIKYSEETEYYFNIFKHSNPKYEYKTKEIQIEENIDFGGIAKGYFLDIAANLILEYNITDYYINFGGSIACGNSPKTIGITDFLNKKKLDFNIKLKKNEFLHVSSGYEQNSNNKSHIYQKKNNYNIINERSVVVISENSSLSDAYATAIYAMEDLALDFIKKSTVKVIISYSNVIYLKNINLEDIKDKSNKKIIVF